MEDNVRIPENLILADFVDGDVLTNIDVNKIIDVFKVAINENYKEIKTGNTNITDISNRIKDGTFSKASETTLQNDDTMFPSSRQVKNYVDKQTISAITALPGYDAAATQVIKNVNGVLTWVTEE